MTKLDQLAADALKASGGSVKRATLALMKTAGVSFSEAFKAITVVVVAIRKKERR